VAYPPPPWKVNIPDTLFQTLSLVDTDRIRPFVPPQFEMISNLPGKCAAGIYLARYGPGSTSEYNELGVFLSFVRFSGKTGIYVSNMYVDSEDSLTLGCDVLGLPKEMASFRYEHGRRGRITVLQGDREIYSISYGKRFYLWRQSAGGYAFGTQGPDVIRFRGSWKIRIGMTRARISIPEKSPLSRYGLNRPWATFCGKEGSGTLGADIEVIKGK